jgi:hypothetical protein
LGDDDHRPVGTESDLRGVGIAGLERLIATLHRFDSLRVQSERRQAGLPGVEYDHEPLVLCDAPRGMARVHALSQLDRAISCHREDAQVVCGGVGHQQVPSVARQNDGSL